MAAMKDETRMQRKQYHLSVAHLRRVESLRAELGLDSDAALIRLAIDTFDPKAFSSSDRALIEATAEELTRRIEALNADIEQTLERTRSAREQLNDPAWIESIRERTRREAAVDPALVAGVANLVEAE